MKKLVLASVALAGLWSCAIVGPSAFAQTSGSSGQAACGQITIKDATEYNAWANATSQSSPTAKAEAIEAFLQQYPSSVAKQGMLEQLMGAYQASGNVAKTLDAAKRLLAVDPSNLRALTFVVYLEHQQSNGNQQMLDDAAQWAEKGLSAPKDKCMSDADHDKVKALATPVFYSAIGADDSAKKDYKGAIDAYTKELQSYSDPSQTTVVPALLDTYYLGNAYVSLDNKDPQNQKMAAWFLTRFAAFAKPPYQQQALAAAEYWYTKYHCAQSDAACHSNPPQGFAPVQQLASVPANVFPPAAYNPSQAPPPPSPADLAHTAIVSTAGCSNVTPAPPPAPPAGSAPAAAAPAATPAAAPAAAPTVSVPPDCSNNLKNMALSDKEFILSNGTAADQQVIWSVMNGVTAEVPGIVISATPDSVQMAVSQDAQQSQKADFTVNMKTPLKDKDVPKQGEKETYIATFDSFTQNPPMIILKDGEPKAAPVHHAPVHHTTHHSGR
ncbi:MAG TPA: hypothetical protein VHU89_12825 [Acidobacteriaceae bacterium]|jgi:hypothetical protein|nr:hypothetical protein [Acidobacteriaceae bacterium]